MWLLLFQIMAWYVGLKYCLNFDWMKFLKSSEAYISVFADWFQFGVL